ncbi:MAG: glycoside hydrolase family 99-like domain-containing protein [Bacteroidales bacterium]|nr:glycoside hydrolase family 99-like domain-containing protein [Bacteroidales bacterium]
MDKDNIRILAFYLPQFYPTPENDRWWSKGFTEWTNTIKAIPLFKGHYQPHIPADLGFYDLRISESREAQADLAQQHGIEGFCYWHYWFGNGKQLLERPFKEVLESGKPDYPFCLAWANQSWTGIWHGLKNEILIEQKYPGKEDYVDHFNHLLKAFNDQRYIRVENKPVFIVYSPQLLPDGRLFTDLWNEMALKNGFDGIYFIGIHDINWDHKKDGFNEKSVHQPTHYIHVMEQHLGRRFRNIIRRRIRKDIPFVVSYQEIIESYDFNMFKDKDFIPTLLPNWDNTPRLGKKGWVFKHSTPELFGKHLESAVKYVMDKPPEKKIIFIKSWNEWAEGNYLEPDLQWGARYLKVIKDVLKKYY